MKEIICPICKNKTTWINNQFRPFCSNRCKLIDLGEWASNAYSIPGKKTNKDNQENIE